MTKNQQILAKFLGGGSLALLLSLSLGQQASAITLVENLTQSNNGASDVLHSYWVGSSFTTGSGSYNLKSATLLFDEETFTPNLFVRLYNNNSGVPGTWIPNFSFTNPGSITTKISRVGIAHLKPYLKADWVNSALPP